MKMKRIFACILFIVALSIVVTIDVNAQQSYEYKLMRLYKADGTIKWDNSNQSGYGGWYRITIVKANPALFIKECVHTVLYTWDWSVGDWKGTAGLTYYYNSSNNGWNIYVCTAGETNYLYVKQDLSCIRIADLQARVTFKGGPGAYLEYIRGTRPKIDRLGPTR